MALTCFVVMGFGKKIDLATGRELDLDKTYQNIIKPAVTDAGYDCKRADEILHSGVIDVPMYDMLFGADLVVADLSTANLNATFELGIRHVMKPRTTIIIAESKFKIPFDASHIVVYAYEHLGPDIGYSETIRMRAELTNLANALKNGQTADSPVYVALSDLHPPTRPAPLRAHLAAAAQPLPAAVDTYAMKLQIAHDAVTRGDFVGAKTVLRSIYDEQTARGADGTPKPARAFVVQQLALATYKAAEAEAKTAGPGKALVGYTEAEELLRKLDIETTTDPETLGLWSAIYKRRAEMESRPAALRLEDVEEAVHAAERGFMIKRDYYNGTNLAYLFNLRASLSSGDDRIADNVFADRVRRMVVKITADRLAALGAEQQSAADSAPPPAPDSGEVRPLAEERYWVEATHAECLIALGDPLGEDLMRKALASAPAQWMADTTQGQLGRVRTLLAKARA